MKNFPVVVLKSLYDCTTWTLTKHLEKKLHYQKYLATLKMLFSMKHVKHYNALFIILKTSLPQ